MKTALCPNCGHNFPAPPPEGLTVEDVANALLAMPVADVVNLQRLLANEGVGILVQTLPMVYSEEDSEG